MAKNYFKWSKLGITFTCVLLHGIGI